MNKHRDIKWSQSLVETLFAPADVLINGSRPWDIVVHDEHTFQAVLLEGSMGLGTSYMNGWWDCAALDEFFFRISRSEKISKARSLLAFLHQPFANIFAKMWNAQSRARAKQVADAHYELDTNVFTAMLDPFMQYSCAFFSEQCEKLEDAQINKLKLISNKLELTPSDTLLDIGCGWGGLAKFASKNYGCCVTGVNISPAQLSFAQNFCSGLPVTFQEKDYRELNGQFSKIVSVGMFEHVGPKNYAKFAEVIGRCLSQDGLFLLHTITKNHSDHENDPWMDCYIFPNGHVPSFTQIAKATEDILILEDVHNIGVHYDKTLLAWQKNFEQSWNKIEANFDTRFKRMWNYYLLACAGNFRARELQCCQFLFSKKRTKQAAAGRFPAIS